jgi:hypothetical protein
MPRSRKRPWGAPHPELDLDRARGGTRTENAADGSWTVRQVPGTGDKSYLCPGCRQEIPPGTAHVVAWSNDALLGDQAALELRRHWHSSCWAARGRRR